MAGYRLEKSFMSELYRVESVTAEVLQFINEMLPDLTDEEGCDLRLIFHELLCNAVVHGNKEDMNKKVHLLVEISDEYIYSVISDEGLGFDYIKLLSELENDIGLMNENGRGIRLVYSLADSVAFNVDGNQIKFSKKVAVHG